MAAAAAATSRLAQLLKLVAETFAKVNGGAAVAAEEMQPLRLLMGSISKHDVGFDERAVLKRENFAARRAPIKYISIADEDSFSVGIFVLGGNSSLPLHDHPGMYGVIKAIHGTVGIESYSRRFRRVEGGGSDMQPPATGREPFEAAQHPTVYLSGSDGGSALLEPLAANIHRVFSVAGPAAFLDILAPPYELDGARPCHYYERLAAGADSSVILKEVDQPWDYWTEQLPYDGPRLPQGRSASS